MLNTPVTRHTSSRLSKKVVRRMVILKEYANLPQHQPLLRTLLKRLFLFKIRNYGFRYFRYKTEFHKRRH